MIAVATLPLLVAVHGATARPCFCEGESAIESDIRGTHTYHLIVDPKQPPFRFDFVGDKDNYPLEIVCYQPGDDSPFQRLDLGLIDPPYRDAEYLSVVDMNLDGFNDLRVLAHWGATGNQSFDVFVWRPETATFERSDELSICTTPTDSKGCCRSHVGGGMVGQIYRDGVHCLDQGRLIQIEEVVQDWDDRDQCFHKTTRRLEGGELRVVSSETICDPGG